MSQDSGTLKSCRNVITGIMTLALLIGCYLLFFAGGDDDSKQSSGAISDSPSNSSGVIESGKAHPSSALSRTLSPRPSATTTPSATPTATPVAFAVVLRTSNIRSGPGVNYEIVSGAQQGDELPISGRSDDGTWLQVSSAEPQWIWVELVERSFELDTIPIAPAAAPIDTPATQSVDHAATSAAVIVAKTATARAGHDLNSPPSDGELERLMKTILSNYDYTEQRVEVVGVETVGDELVIYLQRSGSPNLQDYFGQLGSIHGVIAESNLAVRSVRTFDIDGLNGFVVQLDDLLDFYDGRMSYDDYRSRWVLFE